MLKADATRSPDIEAAVARTVREDVRALTAYHVPDPAGMVKLDAMENPYALPQDMRAELASVAGAVALNRYPDAEARALKAVLRGALQVPDSMELLLGNGSDELIQLLALACARPNALILGVEPSFAMFPLIARFCGLRFEGVPLTARFELDPAALLAAVERCRPALVFIAYPNNPTGNLFDAAVLERLIRRAPGLVVIDEAYHPFAGTSWLPRLSEFPNLLVMRTLSKLGLAGLRLGLLIGHPRWLFELNKLRLPYNVNALTQVVAARVLSNGQVLEQQAAAIRAERGQLLARLREIESVEAFDSDANFILFRVPRAERVFEGLKAHGVLIKKLSGSHPLLSDCLRVTVGTPAENALFLDALRAALGACRS